MCMGVSLFSTDNANGMSVSMPNRIDLPLPLVIFNHVISTNLVFLRYDTDLLCGAEMIHDLINLCMLLFYK